MKKVLLASASIALLVIGTSVAVADNRPPDQPMTAAFDALDKTVENTPGLFKPIVGLVGLFVALAVGGTGQLVKAPVDVAKALAGN